MINPTKELEEKLYVLHKKIWSGGSFNRKRFYDYKCAVGYLEDRGYIFIDHDRFITIYEKLALREDNRKRF